MSTSVTQLELSKSKLERIVKILKFVGLSGAEAAKFRERIVDASSYDDERRFEVTLEAVNMRFIVERSWATERVTGVFVYSLSEFTNGIKPFSKELIAGVNRSLTFVFAEEDWVEETIDLPEVDVVYVDYGSQIAVIVSEEKGQIGINLWELAGRTRRADNFTNWKYRDSGRI